MSAQTETDASQFRHPGFRLPTNSTGTGTDTGIEPVTVSEAERTAELWIAGDGLSLADQLCLAVGERLEATVWTADHQWSGWPAVRMIR